MESTEAVKILAREKALASWLFDGCGLPRAVLMPLPGDASFRRYFRINTPKQSFIVMDAPPAKENCHSYVAVTNALRHMGLMTPEVVHADMAQGFLVITDFGDTTYLKALNRDNADGLYYRALNALATLQRCHHVPDHDVPVFTPALMQQEWAWHKEWFLHQLLGIKVIEEEEALDQCFSLLVTAAQEQPQVFMHRDYHSANLMLLPNQGVGILDFQDAFFGPLTYDLVSLLRDCYIDWPDERVNDWVLLYLQMLHTQGELLQVKTDTFVRWFDWMGLERHLKALFTFARKQVRDFQPHYIHHVPRTIDYILDISGRYPELAVLHHYYRKNVLPTFMQTRATLCAL